MIITAARVAVLTLLISCQATLSTATTLPVEIVYDDAIGEGFNEDDLRDDVPLGELRRTAFERAVAIWQAQLQGTITVRIEAQFNDFGGTGILANTPVIQLWANLSGLPRSLIAYHASLASQLQNQNLPATSGDHAGFHIFIEFNSARDTFGPSAGRFYYGTTTAPPVGEVPFLTTALHELAHGFGFGETLEETIDEDLQLLSIDFFNGFPNIFETFIHRREPNGPITLLENMNPASLLVAVQSDQLYFMGPAVVAAGISNPSSIPDPNDPPVNQFGEPKIYAPTLYDVGSSISHWDPDHLPELRNLLMEPSVTLQFNVDYTRESLSDLGWNLQTVPEIAVIPTTVSFGLQHISAGPSAQATVTISSNGPVDLELLDIAIVGDPSEQSAPDQFSIVLGGGPGFVAPLATRDVTLTFHPTTTGSKSATLRILSNDTHQWVKYVNLSGNGHDGSAVTGWVDFNFIGEELGTEPAPFNTVAEAVQFVMAGGTVNIRPGTSPEILTINNPLSLVSIGTGARGGLPEIVRIGEQPARSLSQIRTINRATTGFVTPLEDK